MILYLDFHYSNVSSKIIDNVLACSNKFSQYLSIPAIVGEIVKLVKVDHLDHMESFKGDTTFFDFPNINYFFTNLYNVTNVGQLFLLSFISFKNLKTIFLLLIFSC